MSLSLFAAIKALILPPTINFIIILIGVLCVKKSRKTGLCLQLIGSVSLLLLCLKPVSYALINRLESYPALAVPVNVVHEQAIVVLGAGINKRAQEYAGASVGTRSLQRNQYAAYLHEQTGLPLLVTGGYTDSEIISEAAVLAQTLESSFKIKPAWIEQQSLNTAQNAIYSAELLQKDGINNVFLVTHAWHMPRAMMMFEAQGLQLTPAPTVFSVPPDYAKPATYLPSVGSLLTSNIALHEYLGLLWYQLRY